MAKQENAIGFIAKMILSIDKNRFTEDYEEMFSDFKEHIKSKMSKYKNYVNMGSDDEILNMIRQSLIATLDERGVNNE